MAELPKVSLLWAGLALRNQPMPAWQRPPLLLPVVVLEVVLVNLVLLRLLWGPTLAAPQQL